MPGLQNAISSPTPTAVAKGGTGNTTPTFSTGPLTVSTVGYRTAPGTAAAPVYSFTGATTTGMYRVVSSNPMVGIACNGKKVGEFSENSTDGIFAIYSNGGPYLSLQSSNNGTAHITTDSGYVLDIGLDGEITIPTGPFTVSTGPLILSAGQVLAPNGTAAAPTYSFSINNNTGMYASGSNVCLSSFGFDSAIFNATSTGSAFFMPNSSGNSLTIGSSSTSNHATIGYGATSITLDTTGIVTLANALPIGSGGTNGTTAAAAIKNLMPAATVNGTVAYYNGTNWVILAPPAAGTYFLKITSGGTGTGGTPVWSLA